MLKPQMIDKRKLLVTSAKSPYKTKSKSKFQDRRYFKTEDKQKQVSRQKIPDAIRQIKTPFDEFKVCRQIYFWRVQVQTNLLSNKFKERYQDKITDKLKVIRFLTKQAAFDKKIRQIPNSRFLQVFTFQVTKTTVQIPQSNYCSSYCFFTFQVLFKLSFWLVEGTTKNIVSLVFSVFSKQIPCKHFSSLPVNKTFSCISQAISQSHL